MNVNDVIRRTSVMVDTSGRYPPPAIQANVIQSVGGGVYPQLTSSDDTSGDIFAGRISLGLIAAFVVGAVAFYIWTNNIQGGG